VIGDRGEVAACLDEPGGDQQKHGVQEKLFFVLAPRLDGGMLGCTLTERDGGCHLGEAGDAESRAQQVNNE